MIKYLLFSLLGLSSLSCMSQQFSYDSSLNSCPSHKVLAKELLKIEFAGERWPTAKKSCVQNTKIKHVLTAKEESYDGKGLDKSRLISVKGSSLKTTSFKQLSNSLNEWEVNFEVEDSSGKMIKDSFAFFAIKEGAKRPKSGCALLSKYFKKIYVEQNCL